MDHLDEVPGTGGAGIQIALFGTRIAPGHGCGMLGARDVADAGRQGGKDGVEMLEGGALAADHQAIAALQPPDAAGAADIEVADAGFGELGCAADLSPEVPLAPVAHHSALDNQSA